MISIDIRAYDLLKKNFNEENKACSSQYAEQKPESVSAKENPVELPPEIAAVRKEIRDSKFALLKMARHILRDPNPFDRRFVF